MRVYVKEAEISGASNPLDALRTQTVQAIAMVNLMLRKWNEPPEPSRLHLSTLLHQIMALVGERGGIAPAEAWQILVKSGTFGGVDADMFKRLLRRMGDPQVALLEQARDGTLLPGLAGERLLESRDIFAVFASPQEFKVIAEGGRAIGQVPGDNPFTPGQMLMLAGRRWRILEVDTKRRELSVRPARGGNPPTFGGDLRPPSEGVVKEMHRVWEDLSVPTYLDGTGQKLLAEARTTYDRLGLRGASATRHEGQLLLFPWVGERRQQALLLALTRDGLEPAQLGVAIGISSEKEGALIDSLRGLVSSGSANVDELVQFVQNKEVEKFDAFLDEGLLAAAWSRDRIDARALPNMATRILAQLERGIGR